MDIFVMNSSFERIAVIDAFESFIWTERFASPGDFKMTVGWTAGLESVLLLGRYLAIPDSNEAMIIETIEIKNLYEATITGRSLVSILDHRYFFTEKVTATPGGAAARIIQSACMIPGLPSRIPGLSLGSIADGGSESTFQFDYGVASELLSKHCETFSLGYKMYIDPSTWALKFTVYLGTDRTLEQSSVEPVIFSLLHGDLLDPTEIRSISTHKNVSSMSITDWDGADWLTEHYNVAGGGVGFNFRQYRETFTKSDFPEVTSEAEVRVMLQNKAMLSLAKRRPVASIDGEISPTAKPQFGTDYFLGDLVSLQGSGGTSAVKRVTEYIRSWDATGAHSYPTLSTIEE